jgi:2-polyprenyl-3-methyl-5-hydroxy-6-metoxy-1,4-benzoquinol methylase
MDQPGLAEARHFRALHGLARINWWSGSAGILWPPLRALARRRSPQPLRVLDVATGGGDIPIRLWHRARRAGLPLEFAGCDVSPTALTFARERARSEKAAVRFFRCNALQEALPDDQDVVLCSLFLHHLDEGQAVFLLGSMARAARQLVLVNDLRRGWPGWVAAHVGTRLLSTSRIVHVDGPRSVEAAFTLPEILELARRAGLSGATVSPRWPFRFLLTWQRQTADPEGE